MAGQQRTVEFDAAGWEAAVQRALTDLQIDSEAKLQRVGFRAVRAMRQFAPVDTGRLRNSIGLSKGYDRRGPFIDIVVGAEYARFVEFGTSRARAQPFFRPGLLEAVNGGLT